MGLSHNLLGLDSFSRLWCKYKVILFKKNLVPIFYLIALVLAPLAVFGQESNANFTLYNREHGLSNTAIFSIAQDSRGLLWFATVEGLNKFDGYNFVVYKNDRNNPRSLSFNYVEKVFVDREGRLWAGTTEGGLNRYHPESDDFTVYKYNERDPYSISSNNLRTIYQDRLGTLWIGTEKGLNRLDTRTNRFTRYLHNANEAGSISNNDIKAIAEDRDGNLWIGTKDGLNRYDRERDRFIVFQPDEQQPNPISGRHIISIAGDRFGELWIGTYDGGTNRYNPATNSFKVYRHDPKQPGAISGDRVFVILEDSTGRLWLGNNTAGLNRYNREQDRFISYRHDKFRAGSLSFNTVWSIYEDRSGMLWVGTHGGLNKLELRSEQIVNYTHDPRFPNSLSNSIVYRMFKDSSGTLWVGTGDGKINRFDAKTNSFITYRTDDRAQSDSQNNAVYMLYETRDGTLWFSGTEGKIGSYDRKRDRFVLNTELSRQIGKVTISSMIEDRAGRYWFGTGNGVYIYNRDTDQLTNYKHDGRIPGSLSSNKINHVYEDRDGNIWVATRDGLNRFDADKRSFKIYRNIVDDANSLGSNNVMHIYQDSSGRLWIGTYSGGLNLYNAERDTFKSYRDSEGLASNCVMGILEDNSGNLWLGTEEGITKFDPRFEKASNYTAINGFTGNGVNQLSFFKSSNGELFFGGTSGFSRFFPEQIKNNTYVPPVVITAFKVFNEPLARATAVLCGDAAHQQNDIIELSYEENFFSFEFSALDYTNTRKNQYAYRLEGLEDSWQKSGNRRYARYTNLPPGDYVFRVIGSNSEGIWNEQGAAMRLRIIAPPWRQWWAYGIYLSFLCGLGLVSFNFRNHRRCEQQRMADVQLRASAAELANHAKSTFLANMSHELRTPLNAILGFAQIIIRNNQLCERDREHLKTIISSGQHLLALIGDVLSISKIEAGKVVLTRHSFNLHNLLHELATIFRVSATAKALAFHSEIDEQLPVQVFGDEIKLRQVLINLLGNAVKFTASGAITLRAQWQEERVLFQVEDSGYGISDEELANLFQPFLQTQSGQQNRDGAGLGLSISRDFVRLMGGDITVISRLGKGSLFSFQIDLPAVTQTLAQVQESPVLGLLPGQPSYRILVVDDSRENRTVLTHLLTEVGFEVAEAENGKEAVEKWRDWQPHLIFMDMRMKVMDGYAATARIREETATSGELNKRPVIIALTASALEEDRACIYDAGCEDIIIKPFLESLIFNKLSQYLGVRYQYADQPTTEGRNNLVELKPHEALGAKLQALPGDLRAQLHRALLLGRTASAIEVIDNIAKLDDPVAEQLRARVKAYRFDEIILLLEKVQN